jgi:hypothetical protein
MPERTTILALAAKIQANLGTDSVPTFAANAVRPLNIPELQPAYLDDGDRSDEQHAGMGTWAQGPRVGRHAQLEVVLAVKGGGADYSAGANKPEWDVFLRGAGFSATVSGGAGTGVITYTDLDGGTFEYFSLYCQSLNKLYKLVDCIALPKFSAEAAKRGTFAFTVIGKLVDDPAENAFASQTLSTVVAPAFHSQVFSIGAYATPVVRKCELDFGTAQTPRPSAGATDGLAGFEITDRQPTFSATIEVVPLATFNPYTLSKEARPGGTSTKPTFQIGSAQFIRVKFELGEWAFATPPNSDESGLGVWNLAGKILARSLATGRKIKIVAD